MNKTVKIPLYGKREYTGWTKYVVENLKDRKINGDKYFVYLIHKEDKSGNSYVGDVVYCGEFIYLSFRLEKVDVDYYLFGDGAKRMEIE